MAHLSITSTGADPIQAVCIGSVMNVIAGHLPPNLKDKRFQVTPYQYGFLLGSPKGVESLGETVVVNKTCYTTSTDTSAPDYYTTIHGPEFVTSGMFLIPAHAKPSHIVKLSKDLGPMRASDMYNELYQSINHPLAFAGLVEISKLHGTAIARAPIASLNIFDHDKEYYSYPPVVSKNVHAFIMGALTDYDQDRYKALNSQLETILYRTQHPGDAKTQHICNHAHVITLKRAVKSIADITPQVVDRVLHLLFDKTIFSKAHLEVFAIKNLI